MSAQDRGGMAEPDVVVSGQPAPGASAADDVTPAGTPSLRVVETPVREPLAASELVDRVMPLVVARLEGFRNVEGRPAMLREIVGICIESVLDTQALDRLMAALNDTDAMP